MLPPADPVAAAIHPDPYGFYARLVSTRPIYYDEALHLWVAASASAVSDVLTHSLCRVRPLDEPVPRAIVGSAAGDVFAQLVRTNDGERHRTLKRAVTVALDHITPLAAARTSALWADQLTPRKDLPTDGIAVTAFAFQFPVQVVAVLLGVPREQFVDVATATEEFAGGLSPISTAEQRERGQVAAERLRAVLQPLARAADSSPTLLDEFRRAASRESLDDETVAANGVGFLFQTCEATAGLIGNTLVTLGRRPDVLELVTREPHHLRAMVEEVLRFDPPVQNTRRYLGAAGMIAGERMEAGDTVLVLLAAANRDPAANAEPQLFDVSRADRRLVTFGAGPHACPGRELAVTIATAGVQRLLLSGIDARQLSDYFTYRRSVNGRIPLFGSDGEA